MERLSDDELRGLALNAESPGVERKRDLSGSAKTSAQRSICAFANDLVGLQRQGVLFVGLEDDGSLGPRASDAAQIAKWSKTLDDFLGGNIYPRPVYEVRQVDFEAGACAAITVEPYPFPPVSFAGDIWVRAAASVRRARPEEERRLVERGRVANLPFDSRPVLGGRLADLDEDLARSYLSRVLSAETLAENGRSLEAQLLSQRLVTAEGVITHAGVLLLGREPTQFAELANAEVRLVRFDGLDRVAPILDQRSFVDPILRLVEPVLALLAAWNTTPIEQQGDRHEASSLVPPIALREALLNALVHRDYQVASPIYCRWFNDRVEIVSPGGPFPPVTPENLEQGRLVSYRNARVAEALNRLGYVERHGIGVQRIRRALQIEGGRVPGFEVDAGQVTVTLPFAVD